MTKLFLKTFLISSVNFGLGIFIIFFIIKGWPIAIYQYLQIQDPLLLNYIIKNAWNMLEVCMISGIIFGILFSLSSLRLHDTAIKLSKYSNLNDNKVHQIREIELLGDFNDAFNLCFNSLSIFNKIKIVCQDMESGYIKARTGISWKSYGEIIEFNLTKVDELSTKVKIQSKPQILTTLIDYGKTLENVEAILEYISDNKSAKAQQQN